jgi:hypothetical protein
MQRAYVGVWIDHATARVVELGNGSPKFTTLASKVEARRRFSAHLDVPRPSHIGGSTEHRDRNRREEQLNHFYDRVLESLLHADAILVIGPGEAKRELLGRMERKGSLRARVLQTEAASRMTDGQFLARLRRFAATT